MILRTWLWDAFIRPSLQYYDSDEHQSAMKNCVWKDPLLEMFSGKNPHRDGSIMEKNKICNSHKIS